MEARKVIIPTNSSPSQRENLHSMSNIDEDAIYEMIGQEIKEGRTETGLWTRLFAEMDGDETKIKVAYIKRRAEKMIATEHARFQKQLLIQEEEQKAVRIAEVELQNVAESFGVTTAQAKVMLEFGIVKDGDQFSFKGYRYDRLSDALNYAKMNSKGARQAQDTRTKETIHRDLLISAANSVRRNPNLRNSLALLKLNGDNVSFHSQGFFYSKYLMKRDGKTVVTDEPGVIRYAQELAQEFS